MKYLVAAAAALFLIVGSAAMAQPAYDNHGRGQAYGQAAYGGEGSHAAQSGGGHRNSAPSYSYVQPYAGYGYRGGSSYYGAQAYSYSDRHDRRDHRRAQRGHYDAPRYTGYDRH
ncbi:MULTISPECIES: hypothetical protein [unclassified Phenylobacterium]|jgi:hypothetical protein|uniref:hypothetical protein n=1 Tax=unclassified Phenylobacterium TaxID=2640670 RepID=UPI00083B3062|nr:MULTISPECIES: hypothetical protein [unclassified Phenylobacterium]